MPTKLRNLVIGLFGPQKHFQCALEDSKYSSLSNFTVVAFSSLTYWSLKSVHRICYPGLTFTIIKSRNCILFNGTWKQLFDHGEDIAILLQAPSCIRSNILFLDISRRADQFTLVCKAFNKTISWCIIFMHKLPKAESILSQNLALKKAKGRTK